MFSEKSKTELSQIILRTITGRDDISVREVRIEHEIANLVGRGIRMDVWAVDAENTVFDTEFQRDRRGAGARRARFNAAILDANADIKGTGTALDALGDAYVIFITEEDVMGDGLPIYHIDRVVLETGRHFGDGSHIIYVNGEYNDTSTPLGRLIHDFRCRRADDMLVPEFAARTRELKESEEVLIKMESLWDQSIKKYGTELGEKIGAQLAEKIGAQIGAKEFSKGLLSGLFGLVHKKLISPCDAAMEANISEAEFLRKMAEYQAAQA